MAPVSVTECLVLGRGDIVIAETSDCCWKCQKPLPIFFLVLLCDSCLKKTNEEANTTKSLLGKKRDAQVTNSDKDLR